MSRLSHSDEYCDYFLAKPALSVTHQETFGQLLQAVAVESNPVTVFVGAGASIDANFPSWGQ